MFTFTAKNTHTTIASTSMRNTHQRLYASSRKVRQTSRRRRELLLFSQDSEDSPPVGNRKRKIQDQFINRSNVQASALSTSSVNHVLLEQHSMQSQCHVPALETVPQLSSMLSQPTSTFSSLWTSYGPISSFLNMIWPSTNGMESGGGSMDDASMNTSEDYPTFDFEMTDSSSDDDSMDLDENLSPESDPTSIPMDLDAIVSVSSQNLPQFPSNACYVDIEMASPMPSPLAAPSSNATSKPSLTFTSSSLVHGSALGLTTDPLRQSAPSLASHTRSLSALSLGSLTSLADVLPHQDPHLSYTQNVGVHLANPRSSCIPAVSASASVLSDSGNVSSNLTSTRGVEQPPTIVISAPSESSSPLDKERPRVEEQHSSAPTVLEPYSEPSLVGFDLDTSALSDTSAPGSVATPSLVSQANDFLDELALQLFGLSDTFDHLPAQSSTDTTQCTPLVRTPTEPRATRLARLSSNESQRSSATASPMLGHHLTGSFPSSPLVPSFTRSREASLGDASRTTLDASPAFVMLGPHGRSPTSSSRQVEKWPFRVDASSRTNPVRSPNPQSPGLIDNSDPSRRCSKSSRFSHSGRSAHVPYYLRKPTNSRDSESSPSSSRSGRDLPLPDDSSSRHSRKFGVKGTIDYFSSIESWTREHRHRRTSHKEAILGPQRPTTRRGHMLSRRLDPDDNIDSSVMSPTSRRSGATNPMARILDEVDRVNNSRHNSRTKTLVSVASQLRHGPPSRSSVSAPLIRPPTPSPALIALPPLIPVVLADGSRRMSQHRSPAPVETALPERSETLVERSVETTRDIKLASDTFDLSSFRDALG
ncbi:hypothetical protein C8Q75DRAFT_807367 [Abortiporus biennis]|nr:hypothetical protein C8Q75DRAFT_807367 [Abortiporus biennis]